ncbi:MATE family efflux transporter [Oscillospiraceae bacterium PP1C4]
MTYAEKKFKALLLVSTLSMVLEYLVILVDNIIVGNMMGEEVLSAITLMMPYCAFCIFLRMLVSIGTSVLMTIEIGKGNRETSNQYFSQGIILSMMLGMIATVLSIAFKHPILELLGATPSTYLYAEAYLNILVFMPLIQPVTSTVFLAILSEGNVNLTSFAILFQVVINVIASVVLCGWVGITGVALGTLVSNTIGFLILLLHFSHKNNRLKFKWHFDFKKVPIIFKFGLNDAMTYFFVGSATLIINLFLLRYFGENAIIVFTVVLNVLTFLLMGFDGIGQSIQSLINIYYGENNTKGIKKTMKVAFKTSFIEGGIIMAILLIFAEFIIKLFGISDPELIKQAAAAIRIVSFSVILTSMVLLFTSYYLYIEKIGLAMSITVFSNFIFRVLCALFFGNLFHLTGVWIGIVIGELFTILLILLLGKLMSNGLTVPLLINKRMDEQIFSFDITATKENVMELRDGVEQVLISKGFDNKRILKVILVVEEQCMLTVEKNKYKNIIIECTLNMDKGIKLIIRDNSDMYDSTDLDSEVTSTANYTGLMILGNITKSQYLPTSGDNKVVFNF